MATGCHLESGCEGHTPSHSQVLQLAGSNCVPLPVTLRAACGHAPAPLYQCPPLPPTASKGGGGVVVCDHRVPRREQAWRACPAPCATGVMPLPHATPWGPAPHSHCVTCHLQQGVQLQSAAMRVGRGVQAAPTKCSTCPGSGAHPLARSAP